ncbi:uncharacterized protein LOC103367409 [Stegastes partitus]|uniref:Uncharacterized protein LOC103367409 n=1 Tax=Stegastes partitus TaxID=144197 RepID=A0A9Y4KFD7_9TELE|nr:PREDICTED: uncharacterized protein LOC103367409 [Stegastes partitus]
MGRNPVNHKLSTLQPLDVSGFPVRNGIKGAAYLSLLSHFVSTHKHKEFALKKPAGAVVRIAELEDTIYCEDQDVVNGWGKFYLPETVTMQVVGVVEGTPYPCDQLVLMACDDNRFYAYDGEELHLVASSLESDGIEFPASKSFYKGEAFKDMTKEDWAEVRKGPVGRRLDQEHQKLVKATKSRLLKNLRIGKEKQRLHQKFGGGPLPDNILCGLTGGQAAHTAVH